MKPSNTDSVYPFWLQFDKIIWEIVFEQKKNKLALNFNPGLALISLQTTGPNFTILYLEPIYLLNKQESTDKRGKVTTPLIVLTIIFPEKLRKM